LRKAAREQGDKGPGNLGGYCGALQHQLKLRYPALIPAEVRCLAMEKLRFSNTEMAALQGISTNAVMVTKHRIRKKLGFPPTLSWWILFNRFDPQCIPNSLPKAVSDGIS